MAFCAKLAARSTREILRRGELTEAQARSLFRQGEEAVVFALLELTKQLAEAQGEERSVDNPLDSLGDDSGLRKAVGQTSRQSSGGGGNRNWRLWSAHNP